MAPKIEIGVSILNKPKMFILEEGQKNPTIIEETG